MQLDCAADHAQFCAHITGDAAADAGGTDGFAFPDRLLERLGVFNVGLLDQKIGELENRRLLVVRYEGDQNTIGLKNIGKQHGQAGRA